MRDHPAIPSAFTQQGELFMKTLALLVVPVLCLGARGDDAPPPREKESMSPLREQYQLAAKKYEFFLDKDHKVPLVLQPKPILQWSSDNDWSGDVFVWTAHGRPQVVGCILSSPTKPERTEIHEFHTVSAEPLAPAEMAAKYRWAPKAGVEFQKLDGGPAATAAGRLPQMRAISRELHASMQADGKYELRLLPQPLLRYQPTEGDVVDGTLFSWVWAGRGTDPELIVALECHRTPQGLEWRYAPLRFTTREVWLTHSDREIWRAPVHREEGKEVCTSLYTTRRAGRIAVPAEQKAQ
jgi:hypothetical protein